VSARRRRRKPPSQTRAELDAVTIEQIENVALGVHRSIKGHVAPRLTFPVRSLSNVSYDEDVGHFEIQDSVSERTLTVTTAKSFAQTLLVMQLARTQIRQNERATKREAYYVSKNWGEARFKEQPESDTVLDDIEAMFARFGVTREQLRFRAEQHGGTLSGNLLIVETSAETGREIVTDCRQEGSFTVSIPADVEGLRFETDADFILCVETGGTFARLHDAKYWKTANCILVGMGGVPSRACRRFVRLLSDHANIPVYAFTDCDPYGFANIYRTLKVGSGNAAHINQFFCVPRARFLGVTPKDIEDYDLPTHPLQPVDVKRAKDALKNDPFFGAHRSWKRAFERLMARGHRAEQQAFAAHSLQFVHERYLPEKLSSPGKFLP